jgi:HPt (histidine-containing phosphotransfer) domain-containing protein
MIFAQRSRTPAETFYGLRMQDDRENACRATMPTDVIDTGVMRAVVGHDSEMVRELICEFLPGARAGIAEIALAVDHGVAERVQAASHSLKGACALVGARHLIALCSGLESAARIGDWQLVRELFSQVDPRMREVQMAAEAVLRQIEPD